MDNEEFVRAYQQRRGLRVDGIAGEETFADLDKLFAPSVADKVASVTTDQLDERTERNILTLHSKFQILARYFMVRVRRELGDFRITSGSRTYPEQQAIYDQGRTRPGKVVTNARPGYSNHNFSVAFDITLFSGGQPVWESPLYKKAGVLGKAMGLDWGGDWERADEPHFEYRHGKTMAQLRELRAAGKDVLS